MRIETIIVDDASSPPISVPSVDLETKVIRLDRNQGPAAARNAGIANSSGDMIAFLDSDDIWLEDKLTRQIEVWRKESQRCPQDRLIITSAFYFFNKRANRLEMRRPFPADSLGQFAAGCWMCPGSTFLAHRSVFDFAGNQDANLRRLEDYDWMLRFGAQGGKMAVSQTPDAIISPSWSQPYDQVLAATRAIRRKQTDEKVVRKDVRSRRYRNAYLELELAQAALLNRRRFTAAHHLVRSIALKPRLTPMLEKLSDVSHDIPTEISALFEETLRK